MTLVNYNQCHIKSFKDSYQKYHLRLTVSKQKNPDYFHFQDATSRQISQPCKLEVARDFIKVQAIILLSN